MKKLYSLARDLEEKYENAPETLRSPESHKPWFEKEKLDIAMDDYDLAVEIYELLKHINQRSKSLALKFLDHQDNFPHLDKHKLLELKQKLEKILTFISYF